MMAEDSSSKSGTRRGTLVTQMAAKPPVSPNPADVNRTARRRLVISSCGVLYQVQINMKVVPVSPAQVSPEDLATLPTPDRLM